MSDNPAAGHQPDGQPDDEHSHHHNRSNDQPAGQQHDDQHHDGQHHDEATDHPSGDQTGAGADGHPGDSEPSRAPGSDAGRGHWSATAIPVPRSGPDDTGPSDAGPSDVDPGGVDATSAGPVGAGTGAGSVDPSAADPVGDTTGGWSMSLVGFDPDDSLVVIGFAGGEVRSMAFSTLRNLNPYATTQLGALWNAHQEVIGSDGEVEAVTVVGYLAPDDIAGWHALVGVQAVCPLPVRDVVLITPVRWWILNCPDPTACSASPACGPDGARVTLTGIPDPTTVHRLIHGGAGPDDEAVPGSGGLWSLPSRDGSGRSPYLTRGLHAPGDTGRFDAALSPGYTPTRDAVAAHLPLRPTDDPGTNQVVLRYLLAQQYHAHRSPSPARMRAEMTAALLQALADDQLAHACLAWRDRAAWRLYLALVRDAPAGWAAPVWALIAAHAYVRGHFATARTAIDRALADQPDQPGHGLVAALSYGLDHGVTPGWMAFALDGLIDQVPTHLRHDLRWNRRRPGRR